VNRQNVAAILVGNGRLTAHRHQSNHAELAKDRRVVS
jgi:hypothetical protein